MHFDEIKTAVEEDFNPFVDFFAAKDEGGETAEAEAVPEKKKTLFRKPDKKEKPEKEKKSKKAETVEAEPLADVQPIKDEKPAPERSGVYESEFDDILAELEAAKAKPEEPAEEAIEEIAEEPADETEGGDEQ